MKTIRIQENIRRFRKEMSLTQEQLAEALGVTVGAVSKWETGLSFPDLNMIVEIADFFEVSVDVLLGTGVQRSTDRLLKERIHRLASENRFEEGCAEAEKALQKYPYSFLLLYECARMYEAKGVTTGDKGALARARQLYERTLTFLKENEDEKIGELSILRGIAMTHELEGQSKKAVEVLKGCNHDGVNDVLIGTILSSDKKKADEALEYLASALIQSVTDIFRITNGFANALLYKRNAKEALDILRWTHELLRGVRENDDVCYIDRLDIVLLIQIAFCELILGEEELMLRTLKKAVALARRFDADPVYGLDNLRMVSYIADKRTGGAHDSIGETCVMGVERLLREGLKDKSGPYSKEQRALLKHWERLCGMYK